jgi:hypothetical protein
MSWKIFVIEGLVNSWTERKRSLSQAWNFLTMKIDIMEEQIRSRLGHSQSVTILRLPL